MLSTSFVDAAKLSREIAKCCLGDDFMIARVIADFEAVVVKLCDFFPGHVIMLVLGKVESLRNEEGRSEAKALQQRPRDGEMRPRGGVKRQDHELVRNWLQCLTRQAQASEINHRQKDMPPQRCSPC